MSTDYVTNSLVWSAIGLMFGLLLGMGIPIRFRYWKLEDKYRDRVVGALIFLVALASIVQGLAFQREQRRVTQCQVNFNLAFQATLRERSEISTRDRHNTNQMVASVLGATKPEDVKRALELFVETNKKLDAERAEAPLPTISGDTCEKN